MKYIVVLPKRAIPNLDTPLSWAMISIATYEGTWPEYDETNCKKVLRLAFHDIDPKSTTDFCHAKEDQLFNEKRANLIIDFVEEVKDDIDMLVVHCEAGLSRSPAIAAAISKVIFGDDAAFFKVPYVPNMYVYRIMLKTAYKIRNFLNIQ